MYRSHLKEANTRMKSPVFRIAFIAMLPSFECMANEYFSFSGFANITPIHAGTSELGFRYDLGTEGIFDEWS